MPESGTLLGIDIGSSSVKTSVLRAATGEVLGSGQFPDQEMAIQAPQPGWAEQDPTLWWEAVQAATRKALKQAEIDSKSVQAIGIAYQMHGLVCLDKAQNPLRPSIIWCDSRAVGIGNNALESIGRETCLSHLLNGPGNFTASKLKWVKDNEPDLYAKIDKICLPGDYIAAKLTGHVATTVSGLSEGMFWDFKNSAPAELLLNEYGIDPTMLAPQVSTFTHQGELTTDAAKSLGLQTGTPVTYRAGDQPNNALSLNVFNAGEIAATAGTSGVVYGVSDTVKYDPQSRINTFAHVNHTQEDPRLGLLLCINGTGISNAWLRRTIGINEYEALNKLANQAPIGSSDLSFLPFGNGAERVLNNQDPGAQFSGLRFNEHGREHLCRAVQEGIVFSFCYGIKVMQETGMDLSIIRAGKANMFLSDLFRQTLADTAGVAIELCNTDGSVGAARGAGIGAGIYKNATEAFSTLKTVGLTEPNTSHQGPCSEAYARWEQALQKSLSTP